ncbi:MAG: S-layer homology domain-containing protein [Dialister sp.]|nr:S-layer homology domain-containing protein [Dialister sp.]
MKKILALAAVAALTAGVSAYAANPFSDVSTDDWAYQAVSDLSDQGVVEGYPDGTFRGQRNMTRFELAQIIARLMAREDQLNAEQRATLDKLAGEYADELANLGVRVSNLEKKVGNLSWSGDARMQYQHNLVRKDDVPLAKGHEDGYSGRIRINVDAAVNDQVTVSGRFVSEMDFKDNESAGTLMDRIHARWTPNDAFYLDLGRQGVALDQTGTFWDEDGVFDGVVAGYDNGKIGIEAGYGRFKDAYKEELWQTYDKTEAWYGKLTGHLGDAADVSAFYLENVQSTDSTINGLDLKVWGAGATVGLGGTGLSVDGDYVQTRLGGDVGNKSLWTAGLNYGEVDLDKPGSFSLGVHYVRADRASYLLGNSALDMTDQLEYGHHNSAGVKFWVARAGVAVQKNVELDAYYNFGAKTYDSVAEDPDDTWGIELNYAF